MNYRTWKDGGSWAVLVDVREARGDRLIREITTFVHRRGAYRRRRERHVIHLFRRADVVRWLAGAGFTAQTSRRYGAFELPPRRLAFIAIKRPAGR